jgi:integrase
MRGHITKRAKNSYAIVIPLGSDPASGKRRQQWVSIKGTKKDAERRLAEMLHQLDTGTFMKPGKATLADFLERWLKDYAYANLAPRTAEGYDTIIRQHLIPRLGSIPLTGLRPEHIQKYYAETLANGRCNGKGALSSTTLRHHHMTLHKALKCAVKWGLLVRNPVDAIDAPRATRSQMNVMTEEDLKRFLETGKSTPYYALFYLALYTGMRRSELLGLRWCDVDLILGQVSVTRGLHCLRDGSIVFRSPKTAAGRRTVALPPSAILMLRDHRAQQETLHAMSGTTADEEGLVFSHPDGKPLLPNTVTHAWVKLARGTGLAGIRLHDARHTHASLMLKQGVHPKVVQERLGHSSIAITLDTYSHVAPGLQQAAARGFDEGLLHETQAAKSSSNAALD